MLWVGISVPRTRDKFVIDGARSSRHVARGDLVEVDEADDSLTRRVDDRHDLHRGRKVAGNHSIKLTAELFRTLVGCVCVQRELDAVRGAWILSRGVNNASVRGKHKLDYIAVRVRARRCAGRIKGRKAAEVALRRDLSSVFVLVRGRRDPHLIKQLGKPASTAWARVLKHD